ncbi:MAG: secretin N-terminal domain-containing protein [Betaproteobacteria bacterium]
MKRFTPWTGVVVVMASALLVACAPGREFLNDGQRLIDQGRPEEGIAQLERAASAEPGNAGYRMTLIRQREAQTGTLLAQGDAALRAGRLDDAVGLYTRAEALWPDHPRVQAGLEAVAAARRLQARVAQAAQLQAQGRDVEARRLVDAVLADAPGNADAQALSRRLAASTPAAIEAAPALAAGLRKPVTLDFHEANLRSVFEALSRSTGLNFVFDRDVRADIKVTLNIRHTTVDDVISVLTTTNQLERKILNDNTVLIYPNTAPKQRDYVELNVRTFYLANAEAKSMSTMLKTVLKTRDVYADDKLNSLTIRDTPEALKLAERVIAAQDLPEPEVMLEVEVLEVKRSRLLDIGIDPPGKFTVLNLVPNPATVIATAAGSTTVTNQTLTATQLTVAGLRHVSSASIGIDNPAANLRSENGDTNILANPRIRVKNREKARILIGDRVPVITTTSTANVGVSESVNYLDVGLKLEVEPNVFLDNEVGVKVNLEVSNIVREVRSAGGTLTYQIGTRNATTSLRLKDGETQALAGLISDEDRSSTAGFPGFTDLPVLGRLFSTQSSDRSKTEIVLLITPRVVRNIGAGAPGRYEYGSGTEAAPGASRLRLRSAGQIALSPSSSAGTGGGPAAAAAIGTSTADPAPDGDDAPPPAPAVVPVAPPRPADDAASVPKSTP